MSFTAAAALVAYPGVHAAACRLVAAGNGARGGVRLGAPGSVGERATRGPGDLGARRRWDGRARARLVEASCDPAGPGAAVAAGGRLAGGRRLRGRAAGIRPRPLGRRTRHRAAHGAWLAHRVRPRARAARRRTPDDTAGPA